ncbi:MAG: phage portal protein [Pleomorphochaeta sp.]
MIPLYKINFDNRLTLNQLNEAIQWKNYQNITIRTLNNYFLGENETILNSDVEKKVPVPYGRKLVKSVLGFMFKEGSITYSYPDDLNEFKEMITDIFSKNDEETENIRIARDQSRFGSGYEILYISNNEGIPEFYRVPASQIIPVYSMGVKPKLAAGINVYNISKKQQKMEVYYPNFIEVYISSGRSWDLIETIPHQFGEVPIIEYRNNEEGMGDIESIIKLIDAHDEILSNGLREDGKYADALLILKNIGVDEETLNKIQNWRILDIDGDGEANYLTKESAYEGREVLRAVIEKLIYSMSGIPNLEDKDAMSQQSGEALKYLYATFEVMIAGDKQSGFSDGLMRRLRLINNYLTWLGKSKVKIDDININWKRNLPNETTIIVDNAVKLSGIISNKSLFEQLQKANLIKDVDEEEKRVKAEKKDNSKDLTSIKLTENAYA